jgi:methanogenic corrinoid protein MtbC1
MGILKEISESLQKGKAKAVKEQVESALSQGVSAHDILHEGLLEGMSIIGGKFKLNEVYVPDVLIAARAMNAGLEILKPKLADSGEKAAGKVILGTVKGDLHDIGKNLVRMMMEGKGLDVIDLGVDVAPEKFIGAAKDNNADIVACSALLTTTMGEMKNVVDLANSSGLKGKVKIMIGGAPITDNYCKSIGADYYSPDAASAAEIALSICKGDI